MLVKDAFGVQRQYEVVRNVDRQKCIATLNILWRLTTRGKEFLVALIGQLSAGMMRTYLTSLRPD